MPRRDSDKDFLTSTGIRTIMGTVVTLTDAATVASNWAAGSYLTVTVAGSRTMGAPTGMVAGQFVTYEINNGTGGAIVTTWNAAFHLAGAWVDPAAFNNIRAITFRYDGTTIRETSRTTADQT